MEEERAEETGATLLISAQMSVKFRHKQSERLDRLEERKEKTDIGLPLSFTAMAENLF